MWKGIHSVRQFCWFEIDTLCSSILLAVEMIHPASQYCWQWKWIHPARPYCWWWKWIHPARPYCWRWKGIHPARPYCWLWKGIHPGKGIHPSQERLCTDLSYYDYSQYILPRNVCVQFSLITFIANPSQERLCTLQFSLITIKANSSFPGTFMSSSLLLRL